MRLFSLVFIALPFLAQALPATTEGGVSDIVGGSEATPGQFPYVVAITRSGYICAGTLVNARQVLTAAHCTDGIAASNLRVRVGSTRHASGGTLLQVATIHQNPDYDAKALTNDIAILDLESAAPDNIEPAVLPLAGSVPVDGSSVRIAGWGATSQGGTVPSTLRYATVQVVNHAKCMQSYPELTIEEFCAGIRGGGKDSCQGDSGGPAIQGDNTVVGVTSFGRGCAQAAYPGVYTLVSAYETFILEHLLG